MNRASVLNITLVSWLQTEVDEIVIVDWSSQPALTLNTTDPRVKLHRVDGKQFYNLGAAYNLAVDLASGDEIIKVDVDYMFNPYSDYLNKYNLSTGSYITGNHEIGTLRDAHGFLRMLNGFAHFWKKDFVDVGGYNVNFIGYGHDDEDLYTRMNQHGLNRIKLGHDSCYVFHIPHDDTYRSANYEHKNTNWTARRNFYISNNNTKHNHQLEYKVCINLHEYADRYDVYKQFNDDISRYDAIDSRGDNRWIYKQRGMNLSPGSIQQQLYFSESPGAIGCFISHYNIWKHVVDNEIPTALIIEDDAHAEDVHRLIHHYDYIYQTNQLSRYDLVQFNRRLSQLNFPGDFNGTECYTVTLNGAKKLLTSVHSRPWFNNNVTDKPGKLRAHFRVFQSEPPQQWNQYRDCIVAAADVFIGLCGRLPDWCEHKLNIKHVPQVRLSGSPSTITTVKKPFWDIHNGNQVKRMLLADNFKWWEKEHGQS